MLIQGKYRCASCMQEIGGGSTVCQCGFDNSSYENKSHCLPVGAILNGNYIVGKTLGEGGFGITYVGMDIDLEMKVAIKEFYLSGCSSRNTSYSKEIVSGVDSTEEFESGKRRFIEEAKILASFFSERGIVSVLRYFIENKTAYIVMEYIEGQDLSHYLSNRGILSAEETVRILFPVMDSLSKVHIEGLIHRDISPSNIMISRDGTAKLIDFGAARFSSQGERSLSIILKHGYSPIEQYQTHGVQGPWTDIYALSATIYKCLTGFIPAEATERIMSDAVISPNYYNNTCSEQFGAVIMKGLAVKPEDRYQSIQAFCTDLLEALGNSAVVNQGAVNKGKVPKQSVPKPVKKQKEPAKALKQSHETVENTPKEVNGMPEPVWITEKTKGELFWKKMNRLLNNYVVYAVIAVTLLLMAVLSRRYHDWYIELIDYSAYLSTLAPMYLGLIVTVAMIVLMALKRPKGKKSIGCKIFFSISSLIIVPYSFQYIYLCFDLYGFQVWSKSFLNYSYIPALLFTFFLPIFFFIRRMFGNTVKVKRGLDSAPNKYLLFVVHMEMWVFLLPFTYFGHTYDSVFAWIVKFLILAILIVQAIIFMSRDTEEN